MCHSPAITIILCVFLAGSAYADPAVRLVDRFIWGIDAAWAGGFSGLEMGPQGRVFTLISDRGQIVRGQVTRANGRISAVELDNSQILNDPNGKPVVDEYSDAEGLAVNSAGDIFVSFEHIPRVWAYRAGQSQAQELPHAAAFDTFPENSSLEALAIDAQDRLYTMPERSGGKQIPFPVYRLDGSTWTRAFDIHRRGAFLPVGADFGPDGRFYLLERSVTPIGFRSRVRRFDVTPQGAINEQVLFDSYPVQHDNLEGISVWRDHAGNIRLTMISDDNFLFFQRTEWVEYVVQE